MRHTGAVASPFLYFADDRLSLAELTAARLDGDLVEVGEAYMPADAVETAALRAGSLLRLLGDTLAATHLTAAWIHGALPLQPTRHTVQRAVSRRLHIVPDRQVWYRDRAVPPEELQTIGGIRVTTAAKTLADLSRVDDDEHARAARLLAIASPGSVAAAIGQLERSALPFKRHALAFLRAIEAAPPQDEVTR